MVPGPQNFRVGNLRLYYAYEKFGSNNSDNIGPFLEFEVSMETSLRGHSGS